MRSVWCTPFGIAVSASVGLIALTLLAFLLLTEPVTTINITAQTETLAFRVANPDMVILDKLKSVRLYATDPDEVADLDSDHSTRCVSGRIEPTLGSVIRYRRGHDDVVTLSIDEVDESVGFPSFTLTDGSRIRLGTDTMIVMNPNDKNCSSEFPSTLPIWGPGELGNERISAADKEPPSFLIEGAVLAYARSIIQQTLFLAEEIPLPAGSRVVNEVRLTGNSWFGSARIRKEGGFKAHITTNAHALRVYRAGVKGYETVRVSLFARQFNDPGLLWLQAWFAIIIALTQIIVSFLSLWPNKARK